MTQYGGQIAVKYAYGISGQGKSYWNTGITGEWFLNDRVGLNYNLEFVRPTNDIFHIHSSLGSIAGPPILVLGILNDNGTDNVFNFGKYGVALGLLLLVAPDGIAYHFPVGYRWDVSPYANVLGLDWVRNQTLKTNVFKYSISSGVKVTHWFGNRASAHAFVETRKVLSFPWKFGAGFGVGMCLGSSKTQQEKINEE